jgi:hypothetical protein
VVAVAVDRIGWAVGADGWSATAVGVLGLGFDGAESVGVGSGSGVGVGSGVDVGCGAVVSVGSAAGVSAVVVLPVVPVVVCALTTTPEATVFVVVLPVVAVVEVIGRGVRRLHAFGRRAG